MPASFKRQHGFSLIELLVVVLIIGILAAIMIPRFLGQRDNANNSQAQSSLRNAAMAAEAFYQKEGEGYPSNSDAAGLARFADFICYSEPAVTVAGRTDCGKSGASGAPENPASASGPGTLPGDGADPELIYLTTGPTAGRDNRSTLCAVSRGDRAYCILLQDLNGAVRGHGTSISDAYSLTMTGGGNSWNG